MMCTSIVFLSVTVYRVLSALQGGFLYWKQFHHVNRDAMAAFDLEQLLHSPNPLAGEYAESMVAERIMLTGQSFQASPDCAARGQVAAWALAAKFLDERQEALFDLAEGVRAGIAKRLDVNGEHIALAGSLHELFVRFLSALPLQQRPKLVMSDGEHPSVARQALRLAEMGVEVVQLPALPAATLAARMEQAVDDRTAAVVVSSVLFESGHVVSDLGALADTCNLRGVQLFVDAYLSFNVMPLSLPRLGLQTAFVAAGGCKYAQLGDGLGFMYVPPTQECRPLVTSWHGCFDPLVDSPAALPIPYGDYHQRFDGAARDVSVDFRAAEVFAFFERNGLSVQQLHSLNRAQCRHLLQRFELLDFDPDVIHATATLPALGGFVSFQSLYAKDICSKLRDRGVHTDYRGRWLRIGPAPYVSLEQIDDAIDALEECVMELGGV